MATLDAESVDAIVTDPPYGLSFMGKDWDHGVPGEHFWREALRLAKPGAHLLAFGGTRTFHRLACAIEDAGWEIRDCLGWLYGSGFPKSLDVSKAIDKAAGVTEWAASNPNPAWRKGNGPDATTSTGWAKPQRPPKPVVETEAAIRWQGWGTALKPAWEPVILARKPLAGTVAANVLAHGTGALNIDGCRIATQDTYDYPNGAGGNTFSVGRGVDGTRTKPVVSNPSGRWPANVLHDGSDEVLELFPESNGSGPARTLKRSAKPEQQGWGMNTLASDEVGLQDAGKGSAARFFYCAKASKKDRDEGLEGFSPKNNMRVNGPRENEEAKHATLRANHHPTVKPTALMRYLCRLITPPGGIILDPFCGSGSTGKAAVLEGFDFIGIDLSPEYIAIADARIAAVSRQEALALA